MSCDKVAITFHLIKSLRGVDLSLNITILNINLNLIEFYYKHQISN